MRRFNRWWNNIKINDGNNLSSVVIFRLTNVTQLVGTAILKLQFWYMRIQLCFKIIIMFKVMHVLRDKKT